MYEVNGWTTMTVVNDSLCLEEFFSYTNTAIGGAFLQLDRVVNGKTAESAKSDYSKELDGTSS